MPARLKVFTFHFLVSFLVALVSLFWVFNVWYPSPLHQALGVTHIFLLLIIVDMVLGPFLTLIVYKPGKKNLIFDFIVIVTLQLSAFLYGLWVVAEGRPAWLVFNVDRFDVVQVIDIDKRHINQASPEFQLSSWLGPVWVGACRSAVADHRDVLIESLFGGPDIAQRPLLYRSLDVFTEEMQSRARPLESLEDFNDVATVTTVLAEWSDASGWLPLMARARPMVVLLKENNTQVLAIVPLSPWE